MAYCPELSTMCIEALHIHVIFLSPIAIAIAVAIAIAIPIATINIISFAE